MCMPKSFVIALLSWIHVSATSSNFPYISPPCSRELVDISVFPANTKYMNMTEINNPAYSHVLPAFVVLPESVEDVQRSLSCAMKYSVPFVVKCGGHSAIGASTIGSEGFVINLSKMNRTELLSDKVAKIQAGAVWEEIYEAVKQTDLLIVGGLCPSVGVSGFTLGGGMSLLSRKYGLGIDNVLSMTMVTANGSDIVVVNNTSNPDLFWALRGGGGGNFGVVVDFTFQLQPNFDGYIYGEMIFPMARDNIDSRLEAMTIMGSFDFGSEIIFDPTITDNQDFQIRYFYYGSEVDSNTKKLLVKLESLSSSNVTKTFSTYWEARDFHARGIVYHHIDPYPYIHMGCMLINISNETAHALLNKRVLTNCFHTFAHVGGKVAMYNSNHTAYPHRNAKFEMYSTCGYKNIIEKQIGGSYLRRIYGSLQAHCVGNYVNDLQLNLHNWQGKYYGDNYEKLVDIQRKWNPLDKGHYHYIQSIGSEYDPA